MERCGFRCNLADRCWIYSPIHRYWMARSPTGLWIHFQTRFSNRSGIRSGYRSRSSHWQTRNRCHLNNWDANSSALSGYRCLGLGNPIGFPIDCHSRNLPSHFPNYRIGYCRYHSSRSCSSRYHWMRSSCFRCTTDCSWRRLSTIRSLATNPKLNHWIRIGWIRIHLILTDSILIRSNWSRWNR